MSKTSNFINWCMNHKKVVTMAAAISAGGVAFTQQQEGTVLKPYRDSVGVATIGTGSTVYEDGTKVKMTDKPITKERAAELLKVHMNKDARIFNKSLLGVPLSQTEYDLYMDFTYNFGTGNWLKSSMLKNLKQGEYVAACKSLLKWRNAGGKNCSIRSNNCYGVWTRQVARYDKCMGANS